MLNRKVVLGFLLGVLVAIPAGAVKDGEREIKLPKGTKIETGKMKDVTRFILSDGVVEVQGTAGELLVRAFDAKGKLIYTAKQAKLFSGPKKQIPISSLRGKTAIDDDVTWIKLGLEPAGR